MIGLLLDYSPEIQKFRENYLFTIVFLCFYAKTLWARGLAWIGRQPPKL